MSKIKRIGIVAEDNSDFESSMILIKRILKKNIAFSKSISNGCGKLKRKALSSANNLNQKGCNLVIILHDLDRNNIHVLKHELEQIMKNYTGSKYIICIPVEEIEAWFLADPDGIKRALGLKRTPNIKGVPESISSPKEKLRDHIFSCSDNQKRYLNTAHNRVIASEVSIESLKNKCSSFKALHDFVISHSY